jgi:phage repressor protein C with HTH and peptisase S24 domain
MGMSSVWLKTTLRELGLNQTTLAATIFENCGVKKYDQPYISKVFSGMEEPEDEFMGVVARVLDVPVDSLAEILADTKKNLIAQVLAKAPFEIFLRIRAYLADHALPGYSPVVSADYNEWVFLHNQDENISTPVSKALCDRAVHYVFSKAARQYPKEVFRKLKENYQHGALPEEWDFYNNEGETELMVRGISGDPQKQEITPPSSTQSSDFEAHAPSTPAHELVGMRDLPIYASAYAGPTGMEITYDLIEYVKRPSPLEGVKQGFGVHVVGDSMEPKYRSGDQILVHPGKPPARGDYVLVLLEERDGAQSALVKKLKSMSDDGVVVEQFNPKKEIKIEREQVKNVYLIVGSYEAR